jgi:hypothetical protein
MWYNGLYYENKKYPSFDSYFEFFKSALLEEADKLYEQLLNEQTDKIVSNFAFRRGFSSSIPGSDRLR